MPLTPSLPLPIRQYPERCSGKQIVVYMRGVSTITFKGQNSIIPICSIMKELTFPGFISELRGRKLAFHRKNCPFDEELVFFSKMAGNRSISLLCFFEVEVILEV